MKIVYMFSLCCLVLGCSTRAVEPTDMVYENAFVPSANLDAGASVRAPRPAYALNSMRAILEQTAAVVYGTVSDISYSFDPIQGPRTNVTLTGVRSLVGTIGAATQLMLPLFGGPTPDGHYFRDADSPRFALATDYLVFLANHDWFYCPVISDLAFRVETINGQEVLLDSDGFAIIGFNAAGIQRSDVQFAQPIGREHSTPFARTGLLAPSPAALALAISSSTLASQLAAYHPAGMLNTALDGQFAAAPMNLNWTAIPTTPTTSQSVVSEAGADAQH